MGQGLGPAQRALLEALEGPGALSIAELAEIVGVTMRRCREVAHSLADRKLAVIRTENLGWKGVGSYGILAKREDVLRERDRGFRLTKFEHLENTDVEALPIIVVKAGDTVPGTQRVKAGGYRAAHGLAARGTKVPQDTEFIHIGVPVSGLMVYEIEYYREQRAAKIRAYETIGVHLGAPPATEARIIELFGPEV